MEKKALLTVEDNKKNFSILQECLNDLGFKIHALSNGLEALNLARETEYDVLISSIPLEGINGFELAQRIKKLQADLPVIIILDSTDDYALVQIIDSDADDYILPPIIPIELKFKLEHILREKKLANENQRLLQERTALNEKLESILQMSRDLIADSNFDSLFKKFINKTSEIMEAERTSLYFIDWDAGEIWTKVAEHVDPIHLPIGEGISGRVAQNGRTINVKEARSLPFFSRTFDILNNFRTRSVLCMPIENRQKERIGVLQVINKINAPGFSKNDEIILQAVASHVAITIENNFLIDELQSSFESSIRTFSAMVDAKHPLTAGHSQRVTEYSLIIAQELGLDDPEKEKLKYAALLHDIGKIAIPDNILLKHGTFTAEERKVMNTHPLKTREILDNFSFPRSLKDVPLIASQHHEKFNGKGYPYGLKGKDLPIGARILAVCDVFDALTSPRDYPKYCGDELLNCDLMPLDRVIKILKEEAGEHFDSCIVKTFLICLPRIFELYRGSHFPNEYINKVLIKPAMKDLSIPSPVYEFQKISNTV